MGLLNKIRGWFNPKPDPMYTEGWFVIYGLDRYGQVVKRSKIWGKNSTDAVSKFFRLSGDVYIADTMVMKI